MRLTQQREIRDCCVHNFTDLAPSEHTRSKLLHTMGGPCSESTEHKTLVRSGEAQSVFNSMTLGAQTQSMDGQCFPDVKFLMLRFQPYYIFSCFFGRTFHSVGPGQKTEVTYLWFKDGADRTCTQAMDVWTRYVKTRTLKLILNLMGSQCKGNKMGMMWDMIVDLVNSLTAALWTIFRWFRDKLMK